MLNRRGIKVGYNRCVVPIIQNASSDQAIRRLLVVVVVVQMLICTGHVITLVVQLVRGFSTPNNELYLGYLASPERVAQEALFLLNVRSRIIRRGSLFNCEPFIQSEISDWFMVSSCNVV